MDGRQPAFPVRASDVERDQVLAALRERVVEGRMSHDTFERRVDLVLRARSQTELADLVQDLPPRNRIAQRLTGLVSAVSAMTARMESAWRTPRLPRFSLPSAGVGRILIGRAPGCHFILTDLTVSRFHAELFRDGDDCWMISDLGSTNGTRVNGWRLTGPARVRPGDEIGFGNLRFIVAPH
jgi:hypothetical protein